MILEHDLLQRPVTITSSPRVAGDAKAAWTASPAMHQPERLPALTACPGVPPRHSPWALGLKRALDLALAGVALLLTLPLLLTVAILIKLDSPGPVLFRQERVGHHGRRFVMWKLRTMTVDAEERVIDLRDRNEFDGPLFKIRDDPRTTRVGRVLRRTSLDELPQLGNVLRGDMSLVGPRPALPSEMTAWPSELFPRLHAKPGITGLWQVAGRGNTSFDTYARLDLHYVENWSLRSDLAIMARTVPAVLLARGAY